LTVKRFIDFREVRQDVRERTDEQVKSGKSSMSDHPLKRWSEDDESKRVERNVPKIIMQERGRDDTPPFTLSN